ncbi:MAG: PTS sugar transporter subunit IIA [Alphaproteobacteria bacterium]|nr:PTS sugar transporter subunit IIA [Alphaproteobacteria bacterium]
MEISDILSENMVLMDVAAESKRSLLEKLSAFAAEKERLDKNSIFEAIWERENLGSTGYGNGVAFPHARINGLDKVVTMVARLDKAVDFDAMDGQPVDIIAMLISPENSGEDHLRILAALSRVLKNEGACSQIRQARGKHDVYLALQK